MCSLSLRIFSDFLFNLNWKLFNQILDSVDISIVLLSRFFDLSLNLSLCWINVYLETLELHINLSSLSTNWLLHILDKTWPLISSLTWFNIRGKVKDITSLLKKTKTSPNNFIFIVEDTSLSILKLNLGIHHFLIRLRNNCNQEVKQNNENENLIRNPEEIDCVDHKDSCVILEISCSCRNVFKNLRRFNIVMSKVNYIVWVGTFGSNSGMVWNDCAPVYVSWVLNVTNRVLPSLHPNLEICICTWITTPFIAVLHAITRSKNFSVDSESSDPNEHKDWKVFYIFDSLNDQLNL